MKKVISRSSKTTLCHSSLLFQLYRICTKTEKIFPMVDFEGFLICHPPEKCASNDTKFS